MAVVGAGAGSGGEGTGVGVGWACCWCSMLRQAAQSVGFQSIQSLLVLCLGCPLLFVEEVVVSFVA